MPDADKTCQCAAVAIRLDELEKRLKLYMDTVADATKKEQENSEKWRESANEWRQSMNDREREFMPRALAEQKHDLMADKVSGLAKHQDRMEARLLTLYAVFFAFIAVGGVVAAFLAVFYRR